MFDIVLGILGLAAIVIFTYHVYQTASDTKANPVLWALLTAGIGIGFQWIVPVALGIIIGVYLIVSGTSPEAAMSDLGWILATVTLLSFIASFVGMFLVMKHVSKIPDEPVSFVTEEPPPPPPVFG